MARTNDFTGDTASHVEDDVFDLDQAEGQPSITHEHEEERFLWPEDLFDQLPPSNTQPARKYPDPRPGVADAELPPEELLARYWGYSSFRPLQRDIIDSVLAGKDTLGLMPTGGGKSITFQVPALRMQGLALVITPLISLMKDQVDQLRSRGIRATAIHSGMSADKIQITLDNCLFGNYKFLYISPERVASERFTEWLRSLPVSLIVIDECHCVCQWGYDFRPSYLELPKLRELHPQVPLLALTATATPEVITDILRVLEFRPGYTFLKKSFLRENISYSIRHSEDKSGMMLHILRHVAGTAIIYCRNRQLTHTIADELNAHGIAATYYHAGLTYLEREMRQARWMRGEVRVMVATNAFGMGIDKPDVRLVIHLTMPSSLEEYFQEAGRAGRDGLLSYAVSIVSERDAQHLERRLQDAFPEKDYIRYTYDQMCNFLSIGEGEGRDRSYDFDIDTFIRRFRMRPIQTRYAIEIMELSGWLTYSEDDSRSLLRFLVTSSELYQPHIGPDSLIRAILRSYTGLFSDYIAISESDLAHLTGLSEQEVYDHLSRLTRLGVLHYIPKKDLPRVHFLIRREDSQNLRIPIEAYQQRRDKLHDRISAVRTYIETDDVCRSQLLLSYFGEEGSPRCGQCDVCLHHHPSGLNQYIMQGVEEAVRERFLSTQLASYPIEELVASLPYPPLETMQALRYLAAESDEGIEIDGAHLRRSVERSAN